MGVTIKYPYQDISGLNPPDPCWVCVMGASKELAWEIMGDVWEEYERLTYCVKAVAIRPWYEFSHVEVIVYDSYAKTVKAIRYVYDPIGNPDIREVPMFHDVENVDLASRLIACAIGELKSRYDMPFVALGRGEDSNWTPEDLFP